MQGTCSTQMPQKNVVLPFCIGAQRGQRTDHKR
jgi:hypothetical protein